MRAGTINPARGRYVFYVFEDPTPGLATYYSGCCVLARNSQPGAAPSSFFCWAGDCVYIAARERANLNILLLVGLCLHIENVYFQYIF